MKRNELIQIKVTPAEKHNLKQMARNSDISKYVRNKIFALPNPLGENLEASRAKFKRVPDINRSVYIELTQISSELEQLGNWGEDLSENDRSSIANLRTKIAKLGLKAIGIKQEN